MILIQEKPEKSEENKEQAQASPNGKVKKGELDGVHNYNCMCVLDTKITKFTMMYHMFFEMMP